MGKFLLLVSVLVYGDCTVVVPTAVAAGYSLTCVSFNNSRVKCFGLLYNRWGERVGDGPNEMGLRLPYVDFNVSLPLIDLRILERQPSFYGHGSAVCGLFMNQQEIACVSGRLGPDFAEIKLNTTALGNFTSLVQLVEFNSLYEQRCALVASEHHVACIQRDGTTSVTSYAKKLKKLLPRCVLFHDGTVHCEDLNSTARFRQEGRHESVKLDFGPNRKVVDFVGGEKRQYWSALLISGLYVKASYLPHSCALFDSGYVICFGDNAAGQLGQEDTEARVINETGEANTLDSINLGANLTATQVAVSSLGASLSMLENLPGKVDWVNSGHTCVLFSSGQVKCFGLNNFGQLGLGDTRNRGGQHGEMGDSLPFVDLGENVSAVQLALGRCHTCVLLDNFQVKCFGLNVDGQLGIGDRTSRGSRPGQMGDSLPPISFFGNETQPTPRPTWFPSPPTFEVPRQQKRPQVWWKNWAVPLLCLFGLAMIVLVCHYLVKLYFSNNGSEPQPSCRLRVKSRHTADSRQLERSETHQQMKRGDAEVVQT